MTKINAAGSALVYSTYLGGSGWDQGSAIAVDSAGNAYVTGLTTSINFPIVAPIGSACVGFCPDRGDGFVTKIGVAAGCPPHTVHGHISTVPPSHTGNVSHQHHGQHGHTVAANCPPHAPGHTSSLMPEPEEGLFSGNFAAAEAETTVQRGAVLKLFASGRGLVETPAVRIGHLSAQVLSSGRSPNSTGLWEIEVRIPETASPGVAHVAVFHQGRELDSIDVIIE